MFQVETIKEARVHWCLANGPSDHVGQSHEIIKHQNSIPVPLVSTPRVGSRLCVKVPEVILIHSPDEKSGEMFLYFSNCRFDILRYKTYVRGNHANILKLK